MKLNFVTAAVAVALGISAGSAKADLLKPVQIKQATLVGTNASSSFTDVVIGTITLNTKSNLVGDVFALNTISLSTSTATHTYSLQGVTFSASGFTGPTDSNLTADHFSYKNLAAGTYTLIASGTLSGSADLKKLAYVGAHFTTTPVPEPETYALMLAGLGAVGFISRRRKAA